MRKPSQEESECKKMRKYRNEDKKLRKTIKNHLPSHKMAPIELVFRKTAKNSLLSK